MPFFLFDLYGWLRWPFWTYGCTVMAANWSEEELAV